MNQIKLHTHIKKNAKKIFKKKIKQLLKYFFIVILKLILKKNILIEREKEKKRRKQTQKIKTHKLKKMIMNLASSSLLRMASQVVGKQMLISRVALASSSPSSRYMLAASSFSSYSSTRLQSNRADLKYTEKHEWIRIEGNQGVIGITDYAQVIPS